MASTSRRINHAIRTAVLLVTASAAALANSSTTLLTSSQTPLCYCHCEHENGMHKCTMMCELPKYEDRSWAKSCHKKMSPEKQSPSPAFHSRKTNRIEAARK